MKITISAELNQEQLDIVSSMKGYTLTVLSEGVEIPNPQSASDFIRAVYESTIKSDATRIFIDHENKMNEAQKIAKENEIRSLIDSAITSVVE